MSKIAKREWPWSFAALLICSLCLIPVQAHAEDPIASEVKVSDVEGLIGLWRMNFEVMGNEFEMFLNIIDMEGVVGVTLDSERQPEALAIPNVTQEENGLAISGLLKFSANFQIGIALTIQRDGDGLSGIIKDDRGGGLFTADFKAVKMSLQELDDVQGKRPEPTEAGLYIRGKRLRVAFADLKLNGPDWDTIKDIKEGEVFLFTLGRATKMYTDFDITFGDVTIEKENYSVGYPGVYSLWLKKVHKGWRMVFNSQPDIWGTRHLSEFDVAEIPLKFSKVKGDPYETFLIELEEGENDGTMTRHWGNMEWSAKFELSQ